MEEPILEPVLEPDPEERTPGETLPSPTREEGVPTTAFPARPNPALTIHVQTWATPIVGLVMLALGLFVGYSARPILDPPVTPVAEVPASESSASASVEQPVPEDQEARQQQLMEVVLSRTRHFKGDSTAPVTLVEFSDFQ